jgi:hypothetical protein
VQKVAEAHKLPWNLLVAAKARASDEVSAWVPTEMYHVHSADRTDVIPCALSPSQLVVWAREKERHVALLCRLLVTTQLGSRQLV